MLPFPKSLSPNPVTNGDLVLPVTDCSLQGFIKHVKNDHNMWAYIYYSIYLDQIDITNHNAIEKYVYEKVTNIFRLFSRSMLLSAHVTYVLLLHDIFSV